MPRLLPPEARLEMPVQRLDGNPPGSIEVKTRPQGLLVNRLLLVTLTALLALAGSSELRLAFSRDGLDIFKVLVLIFFVPLFSWVAFGFVSCGIGFLKLVGGEHPGYVDMPSPAATLRHRTAVLMPVHNESVEAVFARVRTMAWSVHAAGAADWIDFFVLSDSDRPHGDAEMAAWARLAAEAPSKIYYRRREQNIGRKPGNIAEWVRRFGGHYECMLVLDADSLMSGAAIVGLAAIMEERRSIGLVQTVPMITNARTLFQRCMQFASAAYGPVASAGLLWWSGSEANFWGHNAIVRTQAFAESCGLPELTGKPPFGGHILSHDMVESALLRRRGWAVHMVMISGSYEEFPPTVVDRAIRDRRWMQGNLQHLRLLGASGLSATSRLHLLLGASAYLTSPGWLLLLLTTIAQVAAAHDDTLPEAVSSGLLVLTVVMLFGPKIMGLAWVMMDRGRRRAFGGAVRVLKSAVLEIALAILLAPGTMVMQTKALLGLVLGSPSGWSPQNRETRSISPRSLWRNTREQIALGLLFAATALVDPLTAIWLSPLTMGLLLSPWLISLTASEALGDRLARSGWFHVPEPELVTAGLRNKSEIDDKIRPHHL